MTCRYSQFRTEAFSTRLITGIAVLFKHVIPAHSAFPTTRQAFAASAYTRQPGVYAAADFTQNVIQHAICHPFHGLRHDGAHPRPYHGSRDTSRTQASIYKAEGEDLSPPLLLQLNPAPAYSPTNTLRSTIGDEVLNCQVRHGAGCVHLSMSTGNFFQPLRLCYISSIRSCGIKPSL